MQKSKAPSQQAAKRQKTSSVQKTKNATRNRSTVVAGKGFPKKMVMTHKYSEIAQITSATGNVGIYQYRANGMYDPNITGTGHQPYYFDQMSALYDHYTVIGSKILIKATPLSTLTNPMLIACYKNDDATVTPTKMSDYIEQSESSWALFPVDSCSPATLNMSWSAKQTFGGSVLGNDNLQGTGSSDPTEQTVYTIAVQSTDGLTNQAIVVEVLIEYIAVWDELRDLAGS